MSSEAENGDSGGVVEATEVEATETDRVNTGALGTLVAVGLFAMISITAAMTALVRHDLDNAEAEKAGDANRVVIDLKAAQRGALNGPASYVDRGKGVVSLPIDVAKGLVVQELERDPASATPPGPSATVQVTSGAVDSGAPTATLSTPGAAAETNKSNAAAKPSEANKTARVLPEQGRAMMTPRPANSNKPSPVSSPTPTAATPGAESPGPTNK